MATVVAGRWDMAMDGLTIIMEAAIGQVIMQDIIMDTIMVTTTVIGDTRTTVILHTVMEATVDTVVIMAVVVIMIMPVGLLLFMGQEVQVEQEPLFHDQVAVDVPQTRMITKKADPSLLETEVDQLQEDQVMFTLQDQVEQQLEIPIWNNLIKM